MSTYEALSLMLLFGQLIILMNKR
ncbi:putative holin-like toxin [Enterocloster bolteae]|nr:putative holin-like toxin [Enterocloster bolteae]MCR1967998.1 putative holin-like toxin [Enterocloster bolteae]